MKNESMFQKVKVSLVSELGIELGEMLVLGNKCSHVFKAVQGGNFVVVKLGYIEMERIGASILMPNPLHIFEINEIPIIVMQDCGLDFWHAVKIDNDPLTLYQSLISGLGQVYSITKRDGREDSINSLNSVRDRLINQYQKYLFPVFGNRSGMIDALKKIDFRVIASESVCFASFDFTPEDVFITSSGIKYVDPLPGLIGVPIIDMACFAGVARDAYELPGSVKGYEIIQNFAIEKIPEIIRLNKDVAKSIFFLGRSLQCALSSRFRIGKGDGRDVYFFEMSCYYCNSFLNY